MQGHDLRFSDAASGGIATPALPAARPKDTPQIALLRKALLTVFFSVLAGSAVGILGSDFLEFVPTAACGSFAFYGALALGAFGATCGALLPIVPGSRADQWEHPRTGMIALFSAWLFAVGYVCLATGVPSVYTKIFGRPGGARDMTVSEWRGYNRGRPCRGVDMVETGYFVHLCLDKALEKVLPPGKPFTIRGRQTVFGITVDKISWRRDADNSDPRFAHAQ